MSGSRSPVRTDDRPRSATASPLNELAPFDPPEPPARPAGGEGPVELWRRANAATKGTVLGLLLVLLVAGSFLAGRASAPDAASGSRAAGSGGGQTADGAPAVDVAAAKQQDETAKAVARDVLTFVESCAALAAEPDYSRCRTTAQLNIGSTLPVVDGRLPNPGEASVVASRSTFRIVSVSASGNRFEIGRGGAGETARSCTDEGVAGAGCVGGVW